MVEWEYKALVFQTGIRRGKTMEDWTTKLNKLGKEGWELVAVVPIHIQLGLSGKTTEVRVFLKRKIMGAQRESQ